jgi:hypothetical protein
MENNVINYCQETKSINTLTIDGEKVCIMTFYGDGGRQAQEIERHKKVMEYQQKVFRHFNIPINYVYNNFNYYNFGQILDSFVQNTANLVDYWIHFDIDAIPLRMEVIREIYNKIKDKKTIWGIASQSNHIIKANGTKQHAYCNSAAFGLASDFWRKLGQPSFHHTDRGDVAEEITWRAQELGYSIDLVYPKSSETLTEEEKTKYGVAPFSDLDNGFRFGMGGTFSDMVYHATVQIVPRSTDLFVAKCEEVMRGN